MLLAYAACSQRAAVMFLLFSALSASADRGGVAASSVCYNIPLSVANLHLSSADVTSAQRKMDKQPAGNISAKNSVVKRQRRRRRGEKRWQRMSAARKQRSASASGGRGGAGGMCAAYYVLGGSVKGKLFFALIQLSHIARGGNAIALRAWWPLSEDLPYLASRRVVSRVA